MDSNTFDHLTCWVLGDPWYILFSMTKPSKMNTLRRKEYRIWFSERSLCANLQVGERISKSLLRVDIKVYLMVLPEVYASKLRNY